MNKANKFMYCMLVKSELNETLKMNYDVYKRTNSSAKLNLLKLIS